VNVLLWLAAGAAAVVCWLLLVVAVGAAVTGRRPADRRAAREWHAFQAAMRARQVRR
jgi:hypothetical protein